MSAIQASPNAWKAELLFAFSSATGRSPSGFPSSLSLSLASEKHKLKKKKKRKITFFPDFRKQPWTRWNDSPKDSSLIVDTFKKYIQSGTLLSIGRMGCVIENLRRRRSYLLLEHDASICESGANIKCLYKTSEYSSFVPQKSLCVFFCQRMCACVRVRRL